MGVGSIRRTLAPWIGETAAGRRATEAYREIRTRILRGTLVAGTVLTEGRVAEELGMSTTPVRQALRALHHEGLLDVGPRRRMIVRGFTPEHRREVLEVREALEKIATARACAEMPVEEIDELRTLLRRQERAAAADDENAFIELDEEFHLRIAAGGGLHVVPNILQRLRGFVRVMRLGTVRTQGHLVRVLQEHEQIVDAIEQRNVEAALQALERHLHTSDYPGTE